MRNGSSQTPENSYAIVADRAFDGVRHSTVLEPVLFVRNGTIEEVSNLASVDRERLACMDVVELPGCTLLPGFIDGHVHLVLNAAATSEEVLAEYMDSDDLRLAALATENARLCLAGGITTVRDCGGPGTLIQRLRDAVSANVVRGPRILASGMPITTTAGHCHFFGMRADGPHEVRKAVRQLVEDDADWIKVMATGGRMTRNSNIFQPQYTLEELVVLVDEARRLERKTAAHVLSIEGIRRAVEAGIDTLEHCNFQDAAGSWQLDEQLVEQIVRSGTHVSITLVGYMRDVYRAWLADPVGSPIPEILSQRFSMEGELYDRGASVFITSDAGVPGSRFDELYVSAQMAVATHGVDTFTAIASITSRAAKALGIDGNVGSLEPGKAADIVAIRGDPITNIEDLGSVTRTLKGGTCVARDGAVVPTDPSKAGPRPASHVRRGTWLP